MIGLMVNRRDGQFARWLIGSMVDRSDSERLRGFCDRQTDGRTFAILESLLRLKSCGGVGWVLLD